jgi:hypothetical protein
MITSSPGVIERQMFDTGTERAGVITAQQVGFEVVVMSLIEIPNRHDKPENHFLLDKDDILAVVRRTIYTPIGFWHTHTERHSHRPSPYDIERMKRYPRGVGLVLHPTSGTYTWFNAKGIIKENNNNAWSMESR